MLLALDQTLETMLPDHPQETRTITVSNADRRVITPGTVHIVTIKDKPKQTSSISMKNTIIMTGLKPLLALRISNNSSTLCLLTRKQNWLKKWESWRIFPQLD